ncbi:hypothetical protein AXF42_Ash019875 [Apostasia shenzhenica]|uniref:Uncharacterized protein n=1 Tax=Apostasia shenzhenica TaxID=1088818 RepID=A0A2H9ZX54_9ASPA|nr:hypothetical protein AXF42_Ash019875 [Apostasia shenzhenica]
MGNCQATDAAAAVIQHPDGRLERLYSPATAGDVMRSHPGHYLALVTFCISSAGGKVTPAGHPLAGEGAAAAAAAVGGERIRFTRVRLLKHKELLLIGQVYRLVTSQEVIKALQARKEERMRKQQNELRHEREQQKVRKTESSIEEDDGRGKQVSEKERFMKTSRQWQPSLHSISEASS